MVDNIKLKTIFRQAQVTIVFSSEAGDTQHEFFGFFEWPRKTKEVALSYSTFKV